jgi:hypothetical protein
LVRRDPAKTLLACREVLDWLAEVDDVPKEVMFTVTDALGHVETSIEGYWNDEASGEVQS